MFRRLALASRSLAALTGASEHRFAPIFIREYKVNADELRPGMLVEYDGKRMQVLSYKAAMMGRRPTSLHIEMRDTATGKVYPCRFMPDDKVERIQLEQQEYIFLYTEGQVAVIMHPDTFEQIEFDAGILGKQAPYILPDSKVQVQFYNGAVFSVEGPQYAYVTVEETADYSADKRGGYNETEKPAKLSNGRTINVPRFINRGQRIKIKVADESFVSRAEDDPKSGTNVNQ